ncbi:MAG: 2-isopropylmalate synthase [Ectobacillus sp.]
MDFYNEHHDKEEYSAEISPGYRQDVRKEEGHRMSPFLAAFVIFAFVLLLFLASYFQ